jgi:hypothetical protein
MTSAAFWKPIAGEPARGYDAFRVFMLEAPPRSLDGTQLKLRQHGESVPIRLLRSWSARFHWARRAAAWDAAVTQALAYLDEDER